MSYSLLFDIGQVIVTFDFQISVRKIAPLCSVAPEEIFARVNEFKDELECGTISPDEFLDRTIVAIGYTGERGFLIDAFQDVFELNQPMVELIEREKSLGTPLYLLSNTNGIHVPFLFERYSIFQAFDAAIYSHEVQCMKPSDKIYGKTVAQLQIDPAHTIYIDDLEENYQAGLRHGFRAIQYRSDRHADFLQEYAEAQVACQSDS